jgi:superfamily II DNA or RNA helicase
MPSITNLGYRIRKRDITKEVLEDLKSKLKAVPIIDSKFEYVTETFPVYSEDKLYIYIPKIYGINRFGICKTKFDRIQYIKNPVFTESLRDYQIQAYKDIRTQFNENTGALLCLAPGRGKTAVCIYTIVQMKLKTLILVNRLALISQIRDEIKKFTSGIEIGIVQGKTYSIGDVTICSIQTLLNKETFFENDLHKFGLLVIDECHNIATKKYSKILCKTCCQYTLGLSATPVRSDGCEYIFKWFLGTGLIKEIETVQDMSRKILSPEIYSIKIQSDNYKEHSYTFNGETRLAFAKMMNSLISMESRNLLICNIIYNILQTDPSRKILVASALVSHVKTLSRILEEKYQIKSGIFIGGKKEKDLELAKTHSVIIATISKFGEGVSVKELDTIMLVTPKKYVGKHEIVGKKKESFKLEQLIGRIFRKDHVERPPMIIDLFDDFSFYKNNYYTRLRFYKDTLSKYKFKTHTICIDKLTELNLKKVEYSQDYNDYISRYSNEACMI